MGRKSAQRAKSPTILWTTVILTIPFSTLVSRVRLDKREVFLGHRKNLEERLDYNPLTRNAYERALSLNWNYRLGIMNEIAELERSIALKT